MRPIDDPSFLTPEERRAEVASIFAAGILRLHVRAALPQAAKNCPTSENLADSNTSDLEVSGETVLSVHSS